MPITGFRWITTQGCDVHILRNDQLSLPLDNTIVIAEEIPGNTDPNGNLKLEFKTWQDIRNNVVAKPNEMGRIFFRPSWIARATQTPGFLELNGITLNFLSGEIKARPETGTRITSFFIEVIIEKPDGTPLAIPGVTSPPAIAVHVHNQISNAWVTPATLTTRPDIVKGVSHLELKIVSTKPIEKIMWGSDETFQHNMGEFLLNGRDPFDGATNFQPGVTYLFPAPPILENRRYFPINDVFVDPIHLQIKYIGQADPVRVTVPTHLPHLLRTGQILDDGAGNNVFELARVEKKAQFRSSVYATFDDGTMGDLTNNHGVTWDRGPGVSASDITFDPDGRFEVTTSAVGNTLAIKALLPPRLNKPGLTEATGNVAVRSSWTNANPVAERIPGSPTNLNAADIPNVLFIAEGFTSKPEFRAVALSVYNKLRREPKTTPWNHLFTNSMNAWMLFEESRQTAASVLYESAVFEDLPLDNGTQADVALPLGELTDLASNKLNDGSGIKLFELILLGGRALPSEANVSRSQKNSEWQLFVDQNFGSGDLGYSDAEFNFWRRLSARRLVEERDTAWGLRCGEKPKMAPDFASNIISFNDEARMQRSNLDLFLSRVRADNATGEVIGERFWGRDRNGRFGKDYGLIVFLVGGLRSIGTRLAQKRFPQEQVNSGISVGLVDDRVSLNALIPDINQTFPFFRWQPTANAPSTEIDPFPVPQDISIGAFATIAHELCHSFNLDDEYARLARGPISNRVQVKTIFNLQRRDEVVDGTQLSGEKVKWRWPRIKKAGVLQAAPTVGPTITVNLRAGEADQFEVNEIVRFRQRKILETALADLSSPDLKVLSKDPSTNSVTLEPQVTTTVDWAAFGPTSLLYVPVKASTDVRDNPTNDVYAEILSPLIRHRINQTHNPQTREPCEEDVRDQQDPVNLPDLERPDNRRQVVGLYSGGREFSCDIFHPTGECIMRKETLQILETVGGVVRSRDRQTYQFCHVCRYSLVDQIDPKQHEPIDRDYDKIYPVFDRPISLLRLFGYIGIGVLVLALIGYLIYENQKSKEDSQP